MIDRDSLQQRYSLLLTEFFSQMEERALYDVSELARDLVRSKIGPDVLLDVHSACLRRIIADLDPRMASRKVLLANDLLLNGIMTYTLSFYSFAEALEAKNRELELRRQEAESAKLDADMANKAKSNFLSNMSHELRTPLNSVIGFSEVLQDEMFGPLNVKQRGYVDNILVSGRHLLSLINDILDLSKVEAGRMELILSRFPLRQFLEGAMTMLTEKALKHGITFSLEVKPEADLEIEADERKLKQIMFNLLSNAVKFVPEGGFVRVSAWATGTSVKDARKQTQNQGIPPWDDANFIKISVKDNGIGIRAEDMGKLFTEFTQLDSPFEKRQEGTGLGLALTKQLVEIHGGRIRVESEYGKGATFTLAIPVRISGKE